MRKTALVHESYAFGELPDDLPRRLLGERGPRVHEAPQISERKVLHGNED